VAVHELAVEFTLLLELRLDRVDVELIEELYVVTVEKLEARDVLPEDLSDLPIDPDEEENGSIEESWPAGGLEETSDTGCGLDDIAAAGTFWPAIDNGAEDGNGLLYDSGNLD
jgi:hypothetical protein